MLNFLYKHTALRSSFGIINLAIVGGQPKVMNLKQSLEVFIKHREEVIVRRSRFQLRKAEARAHILEGFRTILASLDEVIAIIRACNSREEARGRLKERFGLSDEQSQAVLNMQLGQLTQLDRLKIDTEYAELLKDIERLRGILEDVRKVRQIIKQDMTRIKKGI